MAVTTTIFVWLSNRVEQATTVMTTWICGSGKGSEPPSLPSHNVDANGWSVREWRRVSKHASGTEGSLGNASSRRIWGLSGSVA